MGIRGKLRSFIDSLIPPDERSSNPLIYRTVFLRIALLTFLSFIGSLLSFLYALMDIGEGDVAVAVVELSVGILLFFTPIIARRYKNIEFLGTLAIVSFASIFLVAIFDELPEDKSSLIWLGVVPALIFILKGKRGIYWSAIYLLIHLGFITWAGKVNMEALIDSYLSYALATVILYFYAWMSERYREVWENIARTDSLTGVLNRVAFEEAFLREVERAKRYGNSLSLILFDIDNFKKINDEHGHLSGDRVLRRVASIVSSSLREADFFARWGGEEFIVLLPDTDLGKAISVAEKLRRRIESSRFGDNLRVTASFGVAQLSSEDDRTSLLLKADKALYRAKMEGKNRVNSFLTDIPIK